MMHDGRNLQISSDFRTTAGVVGFLTGIMSGVQFGQLVLTATTMVEEEEEGKERDTEQ